MCGVTNGAHTLWTTKKRVNTILMEKFIFSSKSQIQFLKSLLGLFSLLIWLDILHDRRWKSVLFKSHQSPLVVHWLAYRRSSWGGSTQQIWGRQKNKNKNNYASGFLLFLFKPFSRSPFLLANPQHTYRVTQCTNTTLALFMEEIS